MATPIEDFIAQEPPDAGKTVQPISSGESGVIDWYSGNNDANRLGLAVKTAKDTDPEMSARVLRQQVKTGLPVDLIQRNLDDVEKHSAEKDFDPQLYQKTSPIVAQWMAEHPTHASVSQGDESTLGKLESVFKNGFSDPFMRGVDSLKLQRIGMRAIMGTITPADRIEQERIEKDIERRTPTEPQGLGMRVLEATTGNVPLLGRSFWEGGKGAAAGALVGAGVGAVAGSAVGGVGAIPGAAAGFTTGGEMGWNAGIASEFARMEAAHTYLEMEKKRDANGNPLSREVMIGASGVSGVLNGAMAMLPMSRITKMIPGLQSLSKGGLKELLASPTISRAVSGYLKTIGENMAAMGGFSGMAQLVHSASQDLATMINDGSIHRMSPIGIVSKLFSPERMKEAVQATQGGVEGGFGIGAAMGGIGLFHNITLANEARARAETFKTIGDTAAQIQLLKRMPEKMQEVVGRLTKDGPAEHVYAPIDSWNTYWQGQKMPDGTPVDPRVVAREIIGSDAPYDEAIRTGQDIQIPTEKYATTIAPSEHNKFFMQELKNDPTQMNAREADAFVKTEVAKAEQEASKAPIAEEAASKVAEDVAAQLEATGFDKPTAAQYSKVYESAFRTMGERSGVDPHELYKKYGLKISRPDIQPETIGKAFEQSGLGGDLPVVAEQAKIGEPHAVFTYNLRLGAEFPAEPYFKLFGDPKLILERTKGVSSEAGNGWGSDVSRETIEKAGIPIVGKTPQASEAPVIQEGKGPLNVVASAAQGLQGQSPTGPNLLGQLGTYPERGVDQRSVFRGPSEPSLKSITGEPEYIKMSQKASDIVRRFAGERGVEPTPELGKQLFHELHDALGEVRSAKPEDRAAVAKEIMAKYPNLESDFVTLKDQLWSDADSTGHYYEQHIKGNTIYEQPAFHGTPHDVDQFSLHKIGSGQGAQSYGWGLYFAGKREVAEGYREQLSGALITKNFKIGDFQAVKDERYLDYSPSEQSDFAQARSAMIENLLIGQQGIDAAYSVGGEKAVKEHVLKAIDEQLASWKKDWPEGAKGLEKWRKVVEKNGVKMEAEKPGNVYEVDIPEDKEYLDWDKPLEDQSEKVRGLLDQIKKDIGPTIDSVEEEKNLPFKQWTGQDLYNAIVEHASEEPLPGDIASVENPSEAASRYLSKLGVPGLRYLDQGSRDIRMLDAKDSVSGKWTVGPRMGEKSEQRYFDTEAEAKAHFDKTTTSNYVVFDDKLVNIVNRYRQGKAGEARGMMSFGPDRQFNISLLKNADLSSFLHESGHFFLEVLGDAAEMKDAPQEIKDDLAKTLKFLEVDSRNNIETKHHEQFAKAFETYLMEGKAPSAELRAPFARFKAWLLGVYGKMKDLGVQLTPEVRGVFDRLLASKEEIQAIETQQGMTPLFADPKLAGMTDKEAEGYTKAVLTAKDKAQQELDERVMRDVARERTKKWKEERDEISQTIEKDLNKRKEYIALSVLRNGELPDGAPLPEGMKPFKISREAVIRDFHSYEPKTLPKGIFGKDGIHPDQAAELFGYKSGTEFLFGLQTSPEKKSLLNEMTTQRMKEIHGDAMMDGTLPQKAMEAAHNSKRSQLLQMELEHLVSEDFAKFKGLVRRITRLVPPLEAIQDQARDIIGDKRVRDIRATLYQKAEAVASREAIEHMLKGDFDSAFESKQRELLNHELFRAASKAQDAVESIVDYMAKFNKDSVRERIGKAGEEYLDQIDSILDRFDFRKGISLKSLDRRKALSEWVEEQRAQGYEPQIPDILLNDAFRQHFKDTAFDQLTGIRDSVKTIEHLAILKNKLLASEEGRNLKETVDSMVNSIAENFDLTGEKVDFAPDMAKRFKRQIQGIIAAHTRMEFLFENLDGYKSHGPVWEALFKPMADAENVENVKMKAVVENLHGIFGTYSSKERATWFLHKEYIKEIDNSMTKANMLSVALNWGNEYNREALMRGYGWTESQVNAVLKKLDARDWSTVQKIWDYIDSFWPEAEKMEKDLNGIAPDKVEAMPVQTEHGVFKGGYYPIVFDRDLSWKQNKLEEKANVSDMFGGNWGVAMTKHSHLKERVGTGGKPLRLELTGLTQHLSDVVHDLAYRRAIIDVNKLVNQEAVRSAIESAAGKEMFKQLVPWVQSIAGDRRQDPFNPIEGLMTKARAGATVVNLGLKVTSGLVQTLGYLNTVNEIGPKYAYDGMRDTLFKPWKLKDNWKFITDRSTMMQDRIESWDRDVRDAGKRLNVAGVKPGVGGVIDAYTSNLQKTWFSFVGYMDLAMSVPSWLGAYRKAMDGGLENVQKGNEVAAIDYADQVVRQTQSGGAAKDLAAIQRGSEAFKLFTMFYSQLSLQFNLYAKAVGKFQMNRNYGELAASAALLWFIPAVMEEAIRGHAPSSDDDTETKLKWLARKEALYPMGTVIGLRDVANATDRYLETGQKDFSGSAAFAAGQALVGTMGTAGKLITGEEVTRGDIRDAVNLAGYTFHLPTRQAWITAESLHDWMTGDNPPDSAADGIWRTLIGKAKH